MSRLLYGLVLLLLVWVDASAQGVVLERKKVTLDTGQLSVLEDPAGTLDFAAAWQAYAAGEFVSTPAGLSAGYSDSVFWVAAEVLRPRESEPFWAVLARPAYLDYVDVYWLQQGRLVAHWTAGDMQQDPEHDLHPRMHLAGAELPAGDLQLLVRVKTTSTSILLLQLLPRSELAALVDSQVFSEGVFVGLLLVILLVNLLNGIWLRQSIFLYFVAYEAGLLTTVLLASGVIETWFAGIDAATANRWMQYVLVLTGLPAFLFFYRLLSFVTRYRRLINGLFLAGFAMVLFALVMVLQERFTLAMAYTSWLLVAFPPLVLLPILLQWRFFDSEQVARVIGFIVFGLLLVANGLYVNGVIAMSRYSIMIAPLLILSCQLILHFVLMYSVRKSERVLNQARREAREAEQQIELERQNRKLHETFMSMFSHEVRTPLAIIDSAAQSLLRMEGQPAMAERRAARLQRLRDGVKRITELLQISIMRNRFEPQDRPQGQSYDYDLLALSRKVMAGFSILQQQRILLTTRQQRMPLRTAIPEDLLAVLLRNLLDNALKYSPTLYPVEVTIDRCGANMCWAVQDFGSGLSEHVKMNMFERYFRADESAAVAGLGLGLYLVKELAWRSSLGLKVDTDTQGTRVTCIIPLTEES